MENSGEWQEEETFCCSGRSDLERLLWFGERLDFRSDELGGRSLSVWLARALLRVRDRQGEIVPLEANAAQHSYEQRRGAQNIVLKARQMGISTWIAGRFFLKTITQPGTLTVEVAHNREAAEQIFRIVHRFYELFPEGLRRGVLRTSRVNTRQILFPEIDSEYRVESAADGNAGRGMTIQNLHCSEIARWSGDAAETMASLSAALVPHGELVLESTPNGAYGYFYDQWRRAEETGKAVVITRALNQPTLARLQLDCASRGLAEPVTDALVVITADNGTFLFTGYLLSAAEPVFAGYSSVGPHYRIVANALSEDWLLNREAVPQTAPLLGQTAGEMIGILTNRVNPSLVQMNGLEDVGTIGFFEPLPSLSWSENVAALANQARAAYRVLNGQLTLAPVGSTVHAMDQTIGTLNFSPMSASDAKQVVNDVTITGLSEPLQYVTELFEGDGATVLFQLQREPYRVVKPILLNEEFAASTLNTSIWNVDDSGGYLKVGGSGLTLGGGAGTDGTTTLTAIDPVELGGEVVIEAGFVQLNSGSDGVLCGLYSGAVNIANCLAGYRVRTSDSNTILVPLVEGNEVGTTFTIQTGHSYILRIHVHSSELQRMLNSYFSYGGNGPAVYGGGTMPSPLQLLFELQDMALLPYVNIGSTILYDGTIPSSPAIASFACVDSLNLQGSIGYFKVTQPGTMWVVSTPSSGSSFTRRIGSNTQGADCNILRNGFLHFYKLAIPQPGEMIAVTYRVPAPSVARFANNTAAQPGGPGTPAISQWVGHIVHPPARSSVDCENACQALLNFSSNPSATWRGSYSFRNLQDQSDVWPGDALNFSSLSAGLNVNVIVRQVTIESTSSSPEVLNYVVDFANDWAETIAMKLSSAISSDVYLPQQAETVAGDYLANLNALQVSSISATSIAVNAGVSAPGGGGFEVRSQDYTFGPTGGEGLVLRSLVPSFTITRSADEEQFFIRMYDGSTPPLYSRLSSAIFTNVPSS